MSEAEALDTPEPEDLDTTDLSLVDLVDHVLNKGVVLAGEATIAIADIDLIYLGLNVILSSVESASGVLGLKAPRADAEPSS